MTQDIETLSWLKKVSSRIYGETFLTVAAEQGTPEDKAKHYEHLCSGATKRLLRAIEDAGQTTEANTSEATISKLMLEGIKEALHNESTSERNGKPHMAIEAEISRDNTLEKLFQKPTLESSRDAALVNLFDAYEAETPQHQRSTTR